MLTSRDAKTNSSTHFTAAFRRRNISLRKYLYNTTTKREEAVDPRIFMHQRITELGFPPDEDPSWKYLRDLLRLPWSSRMWIVQESVLNQNMIMLCGRNQLPWSMLADLITTVLIQKRLPIQAVLVDDSEDNKAAGQLDAVSLLKKAIFKDGSLNLTLHQLLSACHMLESTDPRDKIYALLGISKDAVELGVIPNYKVPVSKVYTDASICILSHYRDLDLFSDVCRKKIMDLPGW